MSEEYLRVCARQSVRKREVRVCVEGGGASSLGVEGANGSDRGSEVLCIPLVR